MNDQVHSSVRNSYSYQTIGIPQGCPLSPVLMNIFLHQLDLEISSFIKKEKSLCYVRYADDMIFAIKSGTDSAVVYQSFRRFFQKALKNLQLKETSLELIRGRRPPKILTYGALIRVSSSKFSHSLQRQVEAYQTKLKKEVYKLLPRLS